MNRRPILAIFAAFNVLAFACGGVDPSPPQTAPTATQAATTPTDSPPTTASAEPPEPPWNVPDTGGQPATPDIIEQACPVMVKEFKASTIKTPEDARVLLDEMKKTPPPIPKNQFDWCHAQITRLVDEASAKMAVAMKDAEARNALGQIVKDMMTAYEREEIGKDKKTVTHKLCPSAKSVPAKLPDSGVKVQTKDADWSKDPGWSCLKFSMSDPQQFQYEVKVTADKGFVAFARRKDGKELLEISIKGDVKDGMLRVEPKLDEKRTPIK